MTDQPKYYFLAPGFDFPVGSIRLGSIIATLSEPHIALFNAEAGDMNIMPTEQGKYKMAINKQNDIKLGIFARFLKAIHVGFEANMEFDDNTGTIINFAKMSTEWFEPTDDLLWKAVNSTNVENHVRVDGFKTPVYMVTGIKTVWGASVSTFNKSGRGAALLLGIDASAAGVPLAVGPQFQNNIVKNMAVNFEDSSTIVFAFRVKEIWCEDGKIKGTKNKTGFMSGRKPEEARIVTDSRPVEEYIKETAGRTEVQLDEWDGSDCHVILPGV